MSSNKPDIRQIHRSCSVKLSAYLTISRVIVTVASSGRLLRAARATVSMELLLVAMVTGDESGIERKLRFR